MGHSYTNLLYHIVWSTKERCSVILPDITERLHAYLGGIVREEGGTAFVVNGMPNHVHMLVRLR